MCFINFNGGEKFSNGENTFTMCQQSPEVSVHARKIISEYSDLPIPSGVCHFGFIRDSKTGDTYAFALDVEMAIDESLLCFMNNFTDWVLLESEDVEKFGLSFSDMNVGYLPDFWKVVQKCIENPIPPKTKMQVKRRFEYRDFVLEWDIIKGEKIFRLYRTIDKAKNTVVAVASFKENETFKITL